MKEKLTDNQRFELAETHRKKMLLKDKIYTYYIKKYPHSKAKEKVKIWLETENPLMGDISPNNLFSINPDKVLKMVNELKNGILL